MDHLPRISDAEWQVMQVLWERAPRSASDVVQALHGTVPWSPRTVKTLLNRLVKKKAIGFEQDGRSYNYFPIAKEAECVRAERRSFLRRVYRDSLTPMLAHFIEDVEMSPEDIAKLKAALEKKEKG